MFQLANIVYRFNRCYHRLNFPYLYEKWRPINIYGKILGFSVYPNINATFKNDMTLKIEEYQGTVFRYKLSFTLNKNFNLKQISAKINVRGKWYDGIINYAHGQFTISADQFLQFENYLEQGRNYIRYVNVLIPELEMIQRIDLETYTVKLFFENYKKKEN